MLGRQPPSSSACRNHVADVERQPERYDSEKFDFYEPEDVLAIVRELERPTVAEGDEQTALPAASAQDAAIVLIAAFAGLRMGEVLALRVRDIDFTAEAIRVMGSIDHVEGVGPTKGGRGRSVPMVSCSRTRLASRSTTRRSDAATRRRRKGQRYVLSASMTFATRSARWPPPLGQ